MSLFENDFQSQTLEAGKGMAFSVFYYLAEARAYVRNFRSRIKNQAVLVTYAHFLTLIRICTEEASELVHTLKLYLAILLGKSLQRLKILKKNNQ